MSDNAEVHADQEPDAKGKTKSETPEPKAAAAEAKPAKSAKPDKPAKPAKAAKTAKKGFNWVLVLVPVALISACLLALALPPTRALLVNSPLRPLLTRIGLASAPTKPGSKLEKPPDLAADVQRLSAQLETGRKTAGEKDARITQLQSQLAQQQAAPPTASAPAPSPSPSAVSDEVKRVASYWAGMDAEKAADIVGRLPAAYVRVVFSQMPADAVAEIMNVLPVKTATGLTANPAPGAP